MRRPRLPFTSDRVETTIFHFGFRDIFYKEYQEEINRQQNIMTYLYANAVDIETTKTAEKVTRLRVACLRGKKFWVSAKLFILAIGAIEIPRLLLISNRVQRSGLGNENDLVGRFFMEHPHLWSGIYVPSDSSIFRSAGLYKVHKVNGVPIMGKLTLSDKVLRQERVLNYCVSLHPRLWSTPYYQSLGSRGIQSVKALRSAALRGSMPDHFGRHVTNVITDIGGLAKAACSKIQSSRKMKVFWLNHMSEQLPNPDSRVTLSDERDALGLNRVRLDWRLSPIDIRSIIRAQEIIDEELQRAGLGRLHIEMHDETPPSNLTGGWHHMGTTRMHKDPKKGVVDQNCRVHGISNLFIAGPSVFPTCGYANPVLTAVALSARLADYVKKLMSLLIRS
ncbi:MAG: hypothetical protein A2Y81_01100 [Nitrospirae bacterium RBG_13_43_8]|nr:MAG: hypothetical protein A2Y81_01100 [Nitrospirae bacterium RBG_13_43_8]